MKNKYNRRRNELKRRMTIIVSLIVMVSLAIVLSGFMRTSAKAETDSHEVSYKYYKSIEIKSGDTLWSIANKYKNDDSTIQEYITEVKELNGLITDDIHDSKCLMIVYYDTQLK